MWRFRQGWIGLAGDLLLLWEALRFLWEWRYTRWLLEMANVGQAIDFVLDHWKHPGWVGVLVGNPLVQFLTIIVGLSLIFWDARRSKADKAQSFKPAPRQMIIAGLVVIAIGLVIAGIGLWQQSHTQAPTASLVSPQQQTKASDAAPSENKTSIYTVDEIQEMLGALRDIRKVINDQTTPAYEATQNIGWERLLTTGGAAALAAKLATIRDPMRQSFKDLTKLLYDNRHYDLELRPVVSGYDSAYGWMDGSLTSIINDLNKYPTASADVLIALVRDRFVEWANGMGANFASWYGQMDACITAKTKELREWPRVARPTQQQPVAAPLSLSPFEWGFERYPWYPFIGMSADADKRILVHFFQAQGFNRTKDPITKVHGYVRSDRTNVQYPIYFNLGRNRATESEINPIPVDAIIDIRAPFLPNDGLIPVQQFLNEIVPFTFFFEYDGKTYRRSFSLDEIEPLIRQYEQEIRKSSVQPPQMSKKDESK